MQRGSKLAHYEILSPLGKGGMGEVWKAKTKTWADNLQSRFYPKNLRDHRLTKLDSSFEHFNCCKSSVEV